MFPEQAKESINDTPSIKKIKTPWPRLGALLGVLCIALIGALVYSHRHNIKKNNATNPAPNYKLPGDIAQSGLEFYKPAAFIVSKNANKDSAFFTQYYTDKGLRYLLSGIAVVSDTSQTSTLTPQYVQTLNSTLSSHSGRDYDQLIQQQLQVVQKFFTDDYAVSVIPSMPPYKLDIAKNAWSFGFIASPKTQNPNLPIFEGERLIVLGKKTYYYFTLYSTDKNWRANSKLWQQIIESIKVDQ